MNNNSTAIKVAGSSNPSSIAGMIAGVLRDQDKVEMQAIGAGAVNQAIKAIAIARGYVAPAGHSLVCIPGFTDVQVEGQDRTGIKLIVKYDD